MNNHMKDIKKKQLIFGFDFDFDFSLIYAN